MTDFIDENNIAEAEEETIGVANRTISALESALAAWEEAKTKPDELRPKFERYSSFRDSLADWLTRMLRARDSVEDLRARQARLLEFASICRRYKEGG